MRIGKAYNLERFAGGGIIKAEQAAFPELTPEPSIKHVASTEADNAVQTFLTVNNKH